jgi:hypothetical protein
MRTTVAACAAAILTSASLMASVDGSTALAASHAGLGGGHDASHNGTPAHAPAFGRGFAAALTINGIGVSGPGVLTSNDRWGPNNTVAFGHLTKGWGPFEVNRQPGRYVSIANPAFGVPIACPCIKAYDPFDKHIHGGVDLPEAKLLAAGVVDETSFDINHVVTGTFHFEVEGALMGAVWGNNFDPDYGHQQQASTHASTPTPASASPAGLGGGSNVGHNTPAHAPAFGRGFALALSVFGGPGAVTQIGDDRWGPDHTVAFGNPTRGWGPFEVNKQPGTFLNGVGGFTTFACPCIVAYDPFNKHINGGTPIVNAKEMVRGVGERIQFDQGTLGGDFQVGSDFGVMAAVWGDHFDPSPPPGSSQQQVAGAHRKDLPED